MSNTNTTVTAMETSSAPASTEWAMFITPFAAAIGSDADKVAEALKGLIGEPNAEAVGLLQSDEFTSFEDIKACFPGVPGAKLKKAVANLRVKPAAVASAGANATPTVVAAPSFDALPSVPDDNAWLSALKAGGELKVDQPTVISAVRAALASRAGLYDLPATIAERMEAHAESLEEPVGPDFYKLRNLLTKRSYADIFAALDITGAGQFVTQTRKTTLLNRLDSTLWSSLIGFHNQLDAWTKSWQQGASSPALMMAAFASMAGGGSALPPGIMQPPATDTLRDAAEGVIAKVNSCFAGTGVPVARALAYDAHCIKEVLENSLLPAQVGAANREQMLKMLSVNVSADYVRLERNLTRYVLAVMELPNVTGGNQEIGYLSSLVMLGSQIPWDKLAVPPRRTSTASARRSSLNDE